MPLYEFKCKKCNATFEELVNSNTKVACPECNSKKVEKKFSTFSTSDTENGTPPCFDAKACCDLGKCGSGRCGL